MPTRRYDHVADTWPAIHVSRADIIEFRRHNLNKLREIRHALEWSAV